jgi:3-phosphoshikimate 1-carboxyvinyltransferase
MDVFDEVLPQLGVSIKTNNSKLPLEIQGPLKPRDIVVDGSLSSQFVTGLLMAFAGAGAKDVTISVRDLKSKPYIDLTLEVIRHFRLADIENRDHREYYFKGSLPSLPEYNYTVEGDWSGAAFLLVAGVLAGPIMITGLDLASTQADRAIIDALMNANAGIAMEAKGIRLHPSEMKAFHFDATDCPDLFPPVVTLASYCKGKTIIKGAGRLTHKESNRADSLLKEFTKMGIEIDVIGDEMHITGGEIKGGRVNAHHDHRIAMALAVAGLKAANPTIIEGAEAVSKSYPDFFHDLEKLGAGVSLDNKIKWHE